MLLDFYCDNFKSFQDGFDFTMTPYKRLKELKYSLLKETIGKTEETALSVSAVYGANASGKTSVINAMSCLREIILRGNISNADNNRTGDYVSADMTLIPFRFMKEKKPIKFRIVFTHRNKKYSYELSFMIGSFNEDNYERYIDAEVLSINDKIIFKRDKTKISNLSLEHIKDFLNQGSMPENNAQEIMSQNIAPLSLTLTTDFYSFCSKQLVDEMREWFFNKFIIANSSYCGGFYPILPDARNKGSLMIINDMINKIAKEAGIIGSQLAYELDMERKNIKLVSLFQYKKNHFTPFEAEIIESLGTVRLIAIMPGIIDVLRKGAVLAIDELDASLHPMIIMNVISLFHNSSVNRNNAQLIFNTHNPIYIWKQRGGGNKNLLRRDEIRFVERDKETKTSCLYALSDFRANGKMSVRDKNDYMKNYFINRYGAIENIDFTDIILEAIEHGEGEHVGTYKEVR